MAVLKSCCCGCSLETGSRIIAILYLIGSIFTVIGGAIAIGYALIVEISSEVLMTGIILLVGGLLGLVFHSLLLAGIKQKRPKMILSWLVMVAISLIVGTIAQFIITFSSSSATNTEVTSKIGIVISNLISLVIGCYLWMVVLSHYQEVKEEVANNRPKSTGPNDSKLSV